jgi:hypothetical protein
VSRVRNATEFLRRIRNAREDYLDIYKGQIDETRARFTENPLGQVPPDIDESLEAHLRVYFVNAFLNALNWRLEKSPQDGLPNLIPEAPIASSGEGTIRFLDYLGTESEGGKPLMMLETKRPSSKLPRKRMRRTMSEVVCEGLGGTNLGKDWNGWLQTLQDYVRSVYDQSGQALRRVVLTNGRWLILFTDPADSFLESGSKSPAYVKVYEERSDGQPNEIEEKFEELFGFLEHQRVLDKIPPLTTGEISFHLRPELIDRVMHGLRLKYIEDERLYSVYPAIHVSPVLFLRSRFGTWLLVESRIEEQIPHLAEDLSDHLNWIEQIATGLLSDINERLVTSLSCATLETHYADEEGFETLQMLTGGRRSESSPRSRDCFAVTGANTHFLLKEPTVPDCPHHSWGNCRREGVEMGAAPLQIRSTAQRAFFISGEPYHCAHRDVAAAKASQITPGNRERCGLRTGRDFEAFCEIWHFEERLCCRICAFEEVCTKAQVFTLPCRRPAL